MGLGGYLMWTAAAREISERTGLKMLPIESHEPAIKLIDSDIFYNNPRFIQPGENFEFAFPMVLNNPLTNYCKQDTPDKAIHRYDRHVIEQICEVYGIQDPKLKCEIVFDDREIEFSQEIYSSVICDEFITIEPHTKDEYTINKTYPFEKWQSVVDEISKHIKIVQIGQNTDKILNNCVDLTNKTSFREAAAIINLAKLHVGSEGGLMHVANAVSTRSVIVVTGFLHPDMTCYPDNRNIWIGKSHGPCGMKTLCDLCSIECEAHDSYEITSHIKELLGI